MMSYVNPDDGKTYYSFDDGKTFTPLTDAELEALCPTQDIEWWTYDEYKAWLDNEKIQLQSMLGERGSVNGGEEFVWTQEKIDETIALYEETLQDIKNGMMYSKPWMGRMMCWWSMTRKTGKWVRQLSQNKEARRCHWQRLASCMENKSGCSFLQIKFAFSHARYKIVFQTIGSGRVDVVALADGAEIGKIFPIFVIQWGDPAFVHRFIHLIRPRSGGRSRKCRRRCRGWRRRWASHGRT